MKIFKEKLKNSYISILDYFNEAFKLFWYFIKKEKRWIFLIFSILLISAMLENRLQTDVELDLKENGDFDYKKDTLNVRNVHPYISCCKCGNEDADTKINNIADWEEEDERD